MAADDGSMSLMFVADTVSAVCSIPSIAVAIADRST
jgi:hypothetical protein